MQPCGTPDHRKLPHSRPLPPSCIWSSPHPSWHVAFSILHHPTSVILNHQQLNEHHSELYQHCIRIILKRVGRCWACSVIILNRHRPESFRHLFDVCWASGVIVLNKHIVLFHWAYGTIILNRIVFTRVSCINAFHIVSYFAFVDRGRSRVLSSTQLVIMFDRFGIIESPGPLLWLLKLRQSLLGPSVYSSSNKTIRVEMTRPSRLNIKLTRGKHLTIYTRAHDPLPLESQPRHDPRSWNFALKADKRGIEPEVGIAPSSGKSSH